MHVYLKLENNIACLFYISSLPALQKQQFTHSPKIIPMKLEMRSPRVEIHIHVLRV